MIDARRFPADPRPNPPVVERAVTGTPPDARDRRAAHASQTPAPVRPAACGPEGPENSASFLSRMTPKIPGRRGFFQICSGSTVHTAASHYRPPHGPTASRRPTALSRRGRDELRRLEDTRRFHFEATNFPVNRQRPRLPHHAPEAARCKDPATSVENGQRCAQRREERSESDLAVAVLDFTVTLRGQAANVPFHPDPSAHR